MKQYILCIFLVLSLTLSGCDTFSWSQKSRIPQGNAGKAAQTDSEKKKVYGDLEGEIELPETSPRDKNGKPLPPMTIRIDGVDAELPAGTKGKFKLSASGKTSTTSWTELSSTWKINSAPTQLFVFGGFMVAAGIVLMFFGMWKLGLGVAAGGGALIGCGIMINQYPWVILIVLGVGLLAAGYYIYTEVHKKKLKGENTDTNFVLEELINVLSDVPEDILEKYVKQPLREHDQSSLIRDITRKARFKR